MNGAFLPFRSVQRPLALLTLLVLCGIVYLGALTGGFQFDDYYNIVSNPALLAIGTPVQSWFDIALSTASGVLRRPISMLSFGLNVALFGMNPFAFKLANVGIHLVNGVLVYALARRLAGHLVPGIRANTAPREEWIALLAAGIWLLHPLSVSGVVYIVQRMNELATMFMLVGLVCYAEGRVRMQRRQPGLFRAIFGLCSFGALAVFSKENGALIAPYALVIEAVCFRFVASDNRERAILKGFFFLTVAVPLALVAGYLATHPEWFTSSYAGRSFTFHERLLSEPRILIHYLLWIFVPNPAWMGLFHDDISISSSLLQPPTTLFSIAFLAVLAASVWLLRRRFPGLAFGVAWFLVGHSLESSIIPLELVFEHRNYLPMAGLILGVLCTAFPPLVAAFGQRALLLGGLALLAILAGLTAIRATSWGNPVSMALSEAIHHPNSSRAQYEAGRALIIDGARKGRRDQAEIDAIAYFKRSASLDKNQIHPVTELILIQASKGGVEQGTIDELAKRIRGLTNYPQANPFLDFLVAASTEKLAVTPAQVSELVDASMGNSHFPPKVRAMILNNYGAYQFNILQDKQQGVSLTLAAAAEDPQNPYFALNVARIAIALGQLEIARQHLDKAEQLDGTRQYATQIESLREQSR